MPVTGIASPSWSNEDADDFWDDGLEALDEDVLATTAGALDGKGPGLVDNVATTSAGVKRAPADIIQDADVSKLVDGSKALDTLCSDDAGHDETATHHTENDKSSGQDVHQHTLNHTGMLKSEPAPGDDGLARPNDDSSDALEETSQPAANKEMTAFEQAEEAMANIDDVLSPKDPSADDEDLRTDQSFLGAISKSPEQITQVHGSRNTISPHVSAEALPTALDTQQSAAETNPIVPKSEISQFLEQIQALKAELEEKNARIQHFEASRADSVASSDNAALADRVVQLEERLQTTEQERDEAQSQLEGFLSKISSMKTVFQNFKATQMELDEVKQELDQQRQAREEAERFSHVMQAQVLELEKEVQSLAARQQSWDSETKNHLGVIESLRNEALDLNAECDRLSQILGALRREFQSKEESLQDEKYTLEHEVSRLNKKLSEQKSMHSELELAKEEAVIESKNLLLALEESQERLADRESDYQKLLTLVQNSAKALEDKLNEMECQMKAKEAQLADACSKIEDMGREMTLLRLQTEDAACVTAALQKDLEKMKQLEEDVHSKQLIIGKLRHEAIILNEHLTKSLLMLKQQLGDSDQTVDRELVSNMVLNFLQIPRGDTKKFEALSLIAGLLNWDDQKKIQAGLMHSGRSDESKQRLGLISLWTDFLDKESTKK